MKSLTSLTSLALLTTLSLAAPLHPRQQFVSTCPFNYPATLNTTESLNGLILTIASNNPATNNRAVQLRSAPISVPAQPPSYSPSTNTTTSSTPVPSVVQVAAIDSTSPVFLTQLRAGVLHSENRSSYNQLYDLGPTGALMKVPEAGDSERTAKYALQFENRTESEWDADWYLEGGSGDGTYNLYRHVGDGVVNGFILCEAKEKDTGEKWWQLFYQTYVSQPPERVGCEYIGVRTTAAANIFNGKCDIGGYTA